MRRDGRQVYLCANSGGLSKAQMAVRTAECLGKERSRISTIQHAWTGQGTGRMETRLRGAEPTQNVENDACVSPEGDNIALISPPGKPLLRAMAGQTAIGVDARTMWRQYRQLKFCLPRGFLALRHHQAGHGTSQPSCLRARHANKKARVAGLKSRKSRTQRRKSRARLTRLNARMSRAVCQYRLRLSPARQFFARITNGAMGVPGGDRLARGAWSQAAGPRAPRIAFRWAGQALTAS
ncbi:hypothetical protein AWB78_08561 [Caballeronia calidae]|uniref:Uncharacterized protein n=1 Tax=Caballeronia calidae TaxID=1777139 RepID=A0A158ELZ7_9BURK|nr:hypothetical protein AWB78_08561 [Caballeronia calidae]